MKVTELGTRLFGQWSSIYNDFRNSYTRFSSDNREAICFSYSYMPFKECIMSPCKEIFDVKKAAAMYFWYKRAEPTDYSIMKYFEEYKHCIDENHTCFNSNYGIYAYEQQGLDKCVFELQRDKNSRRAMFCINNNEAMSDTSIDKLCTNTIQFMIRSNALSMVVQMRSSNFLTLLPYDAFMFSVFYMYVYNELIKSNARLIANKIFINATSLHIYDADLEKIPNDASICKANYNLVERVEKLQGNHNWMTDLENELLKLIQL